MNESGTDAGRGTPTVDADARGHGRAGGTEASFHRVPRAELESRIARLQARLAAAGDAEAVFVFQAADLLYFTGTAQDAWLVIPLEGRPLLLVRRSFERAREESLLDDILPLPSRREVPARLASRGWKGLRRVGLEFDVLPLEHYVRLGRMFPTLQFVDVSRLIRETRMIKSPYEVERLRTAAKIQDRMAARLRQTLRDGLTELEVAAEVEAEARRLGHQGLIRTRRFNFDMFYGHLLSGESGVAPSYVESPTGGRGISPAFGSGAGPRRIRRHEPVMLDYVAVWEGYHSDQTRLFSVGELPAPLVRAYDACLAIHDAVLERLRPGVRAAEVYGQAAQVAARLGYADGFMNTGAAQVKYVGHGVGVELDETPVLGQGSDVTLETGMTLAVEPKIGCPGAGVVGLEDTVLLTSGEPEILTVTSREIAIV
jgi:Xaa-Pro aminopeptidase